MQSQPSVTLPLPEDADDMATLFSCMRLKSVHVCDGGRCRLYLARREVPFIKDGQPTVYRGSHFVLTFGERLAEGQLLLETDTETLSQAFERRIEEWRRSHYCNGCPTNHNNCTAQAAVVV